MKKEIVEDLLNKLKTMVEVAIKDSVEGDEVVKSLQEDYDAFFLWAFGREVDMVNKISKDECIKKWKKLHPKLEIPRILQSDFDLGKELSTVCLFMDAYPLFLQEQD